MRLKRFTWVFIFVIAILHAPTLRADGPDAESQTVSLIVGRSMVLNTPAPIARVSLTSSDIADALVTSSTQLLLHGKAPGTISMFVWNREGDVQRYEVSVGRDLEKLTEEFHELFPKEKIDVRSNGHNVVLSGTVSTKDVAEKAAGLGATFVDKREDVVNLLQVGPTRTNQVLLRVRFAEVSRNALTELGMSLFTSPTGIQNTLGRVTTQQFGSADFSDLSWSKADNSFGSDVTSASG